MATPGGVWCRADFMYGGNDQIWSNSFWYTGTGSFGSTWSATTFATAVYSHLKSALAAVMSDTNSLLGVYNLVSNGTNTIGTDLYNVTTGAVTGDALPLEVAVVVQRISDQPGKSGRGRVYLMGLDESMVSGNYIDPTKLSLFVAIANAMKSAVVDQSITWSPAVYTRKLNALHAIASTNVVSLCATHRATRPRF